MAGAWRYLSMAAIIALLSGSAAAQAHSFGLSYTLPVPLWLYAYGTIATLLLTFGLLLVLPRTRPRAVDADIVQGATGRCFLVPAQLAAVPRLLSTSVFGYLIYEGFAGNQDVGHNIAMLLFWVIFLLGMTYLNFFVAGLYDLFNPLVLPCAILARLAGGHLLDGEPLSRVLTFLPLAAYAALLYIELQVAVTPAITAAFLTVYAGITVLGVLLFGERRWFARADIFRAYFSLISRIAPITLKVGRGDMWAHHGTGEGARGMVAGVADATFILLILAGTSYDAIRETTFWIGLYWKTLLALLSQSGVVDLGQAQRALMGGYLVYRQMGIVIMLLLYMAVYTGATGLTWLITGRQLRLNTLYISFATSLIPVVIAYHFIHYFPFFLAEVSTLPHLIAEVLLPGTRAYDQLTLPMSVVWHTQVIVLLLGHMAGVWIAHDNARQLIQGSRNTVVGQLPHLMLIVTFTIFGLWILSLPLA